MKAILSFVSVLFFFSFSTAQNVSINETGNPPDATAMLDVSSQTKGFLLPRMNSLERTNISFPQTGLLVYDLDLQSLFYFDGGHWVEFASSRKGLRDSDFDTKVLVEQSTDDDTIRLMSNGLEKLKVHDKGIKYTSYFNHSNIYIGDGIGEVGRDNIVIGLDSVGNSFTSGTRRNIVIGNKSSLNLTNFESDDNVIVGHNSAQNLITGEQNTVLGFESFNASNGTHNVSIGAFAGPTGDSYDNISIGSYAGNTDFPSDNSVFIGKNAGSPMYRCSDCIILGSNTGQTDLIGNNLLMIDNQETSEPLIYGNFSSNNVGIHGNLAVGSKYPDSELHVIHGNSGSEDGFKLENEDNGNYWRFYIRSSNGNLRLYSTEGESNGCGNNGGADDYVVWVGGCSGTWFNTSDRRKKKSFIKLKSVLPALMNLQVLKYNFLSEDDTEKKHIGLIAQDVQDYFPELVNYDEESDLYTMNYDGFGPIALKGVQELKLENESLKKELFQQKTEIDELRTQLEELATLIKSE